MNSSTNKFIVNELQFEAVAERLKTALELKTSNALAEALDMSSSAFANRKQAGSLPFEAIIKLALARDLSLDWVFTGRGEPLVDEKRGSRITPVAAIDKELFGLIFHRLWAGYPKVQGKSADAVPHTLLAGFPEEERGHLRRLAEEITKIVDADLKYLAVQCALQAASTYNKVASIESKELREEAARIDADETLSVIRLSAVLRDRGQNALSIQEGPLTEQKTISGGGNLVVSRDTAKKSAKRKK